MYLRRLKDVTKKTSLLGCFWEVSEISLSMEIWLRSLRDISYRLGWDYWWKNRWNVSARRTYSPLNEILQIALRWDVENIYKMHISYYQYQRYSMKLKWRRTVSSPWHWQTFFKDTIPCLTYNFHTPEFVNHIS